MIACIFDTETTGLIENRSVPLDKQPEITEIYACVCDLRTGEILEEIDELVKPKGKITDEIIKITGITPALVESAPPFSSIADRVVSLVQSADVIIAHNLSFDMEMVEIELERIGKEIRWPRPLCTVEQTIYLKGYRLSLSNLHDQLFNKPFSGAHRAKIDVEALTRCAVELYKGGLL